MTKQESKQIRAKRDKYIERMINRIKKTFPEARFDISRGPGPRRAWIDVRADTDCIFDITDPISPIRVKAMDEGFFFYFLRSS